FIAAGNAAWRVTIAERDRYASESGHWTREQVELFLPARGPTLVYLEREKLLVPAERFRETFPLYHPRDVKLYARARRQSDDHRVRMHRDPAKIRRWARNRGYSRQKADELAARAAERA